MRNELGSDVQISDLQDLCESGEVGLRGLSIQIDLERNTEENVSSQAHITEDERQWTKLTSSFGPNLSFQRSTAFSRIFSGSCSFDDDDGSRSDDDEYIEMRASEAWTSAASFSCLTSLL